MKTKHLSLVALAMIMGVATYAQDTIPQKDTTKKDTTTIPQKDTLVKFVAMNNSQMSATDTIPEKTDTTKKDTPTVASYAMINVYQDTTTHPQKDTTGKDTASSASYAMINASQDTTTLPKKDTTDKPKKDTTSSYAMLNNLQENNGSLKNEEALFILPKSEKSIGLV